MVSRFVAIERGDPIDTDKGTRIWVFDHGYHTGLVLPRSVLETLGDRNSVDWLKQFPDAEWFEFGWGDAGFYFEVPTFRDVTLAIGLKALLVPSRSVLHIATGRGNPEIVFRSSEYITLHISADALSEMLRFVESGAVSTNQLGPGLYGVGAFYEGSGQYHAFQTCNSWVSQALRAGGVASAPGPAVLSFGLIWDLHRRYGAE
ncbi:DUF2459 domain-containing protein [Shimia sp. R9_2]|uniref:DUF2459 domain-containing protein n=1 Tax=Shimia sp. R9_2 TaxID=2821112 RepID=UPI001ADAEC03|nr:DUF2459 domain-containing protein [Shimia sp. R9_2]MBO9397255.1 DUF2459 domain-containing protein [Shimia sp. R9_2]